MHHSSYIARRFTNSVYNPVTTSDRGLIQRQQDVMRLQDDMIAEIGVGVDRLHGQAVAIGEETKIHSRLLDDLDTNVDMATAALQVRNCKPVYFVLFR